MIKTAANIAIVYRNFIAVQKLPNYCVRKECGRQNIRPPELTANIYLFYLSSLVIFSIKCLSRSITCCNRVKSKFSHHNQFTKGQLIRFLIGYAVTHLWMVDFTLSIHYLVFFRNRTSPHFKRKTGRWSNCFNRHCRRLREAFLFFVRYQSLRELLNVFTLHEML